MEFKKTECALLALLRAGVWMRSPDDQHLFPLSKEEWREVFQIASKQTVIGHVFQGICLLEDQQMPPQDLLEEWVVEVDRIEQKYNAMAEVINNLLETFHSCGLRPKLIKGHAVAQFYTTPSQRTSGDIDLFFPNKNEFKQANTIIEDRGKKGSYMPDGSYIYLWEGIHVEHHCKMLDVYNPLHRKHIKNLIATEDDNELYPTPLLNILLQSTHVLKHMLGHGIGLRQLADLARTCHIQGKVLDKQQYIREIEYLGIKHWCANLNAILVDYLGLSPEALPFDNIERTATEHIMQKIWHGGNFGKYIHKDNKKENNNLSFNTITYLLNGWKFMIELAPSESIWYGLSLLKERFDRIKHSFIQ